jgi:hypothetical protein
MMEIDRGRQVYQIPQLEIHVWHMLTEASLIVGSSASPDDPLQTVHPGNSQ